MLLDEGFKRPWPPLIRMDEKVRKKVDGLFGGKHEDRITCRAGALAQAEDGHRGEGESGKAFQPVTVVSASRIQETASIEDSMLQLPERMEIKSPTTTPKRK